MTEHIPRPHSSDLHGAYNPLTYGGDMSADTKPGVSLDHNSITDQPMVPEASAHRGNGPRWRRTRKLGAAVVAGGCMLYPGGVVDKVLDAVTDEQRVVTEAAEEMLLPPIDLDQKHDGITLRDSPYSYQQRVIEEQQTYNKQIKAAAQEVAQTMADLDGHNYGAIRQRADEYIQNHPGFVMTEQSRKDMSNAIETSRNVDELIAAAKPFSEFSGKRLNPVPGTEYDFETVKHATNEYITELSTYPKDIFSMSDAQTITIGAPDNLSPGYAVTVGTYSSVHKEITLRPFGFETGRLTTWWPLYAMQDGSSNNLAAHELGHSMHTGPIVKKDSNNSGDAHIMYSPLDLLVGGVLGYPQEVSSYARSSHGEQAAEATAGVLSDTKTGLAHPDEAKTYLSPANKQVLQTLMSIGKGKPGLVSYLVGKNDRLMNRHPLQLGR